MGSTNQATTPMTTFESSIFELQRRSDMVPAGWQSAYVTMIARLIAINCNTRSKFELDAARYDDDVNRVVVRFHNSDRAIRGILRKMTLTMQCTCEVCGKKGKLVPLPIHAKILCASCHAPHLLESQLDVFLERLEVGDLSENNGVLTRQDLEPEVRPLIPAVHWHQIQLTPNMQIEYVSSADLRKLQPRFHAIRRFVREQIDSAV